MSWVEAKEHWIIGNGELHFKKKSASHVWKMTMCVLNNIVVLRSMRAHVW